MNRAFAALILLFASLLPGAGRELTISNPEFSATISFNGKRFDGASFGTEKEDSQAPLFEFCINGELLTSDMPIWKYLGNDSCCLSNGGTIVSYKFRGRGRYRALQLCWDREYFPDGAFIRERLRLRCSDGSLALTDMDGANHFIFPRYTIPSHDSRPSARELRIGSFRTGRNMQDHHMNHPDSLSYGLSPEAIHTKGPFLIINDDGRAIWTAYEHASQDHGFVSRRSKSKGNDGQQGTKGDMGAITDDLLWFISTDASADRGHITLGNHIRRGGYINGEKIPSGQWYETVWSVIAFEDDPDRVNSAIGEYLLTRITDNPASRRPDFYYNTWGMQRDVPNEQLYQVMNESRLLQEIDLAAEAGVQVFVVDDGWHVTFGDWRCNMERFPNGLKPLVDRMHSHGITPGIWISLCGAGKETQRTLEHPEWLIRDRNGEPIAAQWGNPVYDLVGPFYDLLLSDMKALIDQGFRFFKWDGINLFNSDLCGLGHGDDADDRQERIDRYNYLFPFYVTRLMREMREYCPGTVVEIDLTEVERNLIGLMVLQEGKYYFINNGASVYRDYSEKRTRSVRSTINEYASIIPQELFTYAVYPRDDAGALKYNIATAVQAGHGIWGDLTATTVAQRQYISGQYALAKQVLPHVHGRLVEVSGGIHDTPEVYVQRNPEEGYAIMTAFGDSRYDGAWHIDMDCSKVLDVVGSPYSTDSTGIVIPLSFSGNGPESISVFIIGKN